MSLDEKSKWRKSIIRRIMNKFIEYYKKEKETIKEKASKKEKKK